MTPMRGGLALLLAATLLLHVAMLAGSHAPVPDAAPVAVVALRAAPEAPGGSSDHGPHIVAACFAVLAVVVAGGALRLLMPVVWLSRVGPLPQRAPQGAASRLGACARAAPSWAVPVDAGVLLRV